LQEIQEIKEDLIIGRNTVLEAIKSGRDIDFIMILEKNTDSSLKQIVLQAKKRGIVIKEVPLAKLNETARPFGYAGKTANHQGVIAKIPAVRYAEIEDIFHYAQKQAKPPFIIALNEIKDPHNLGAIVRSAEAFGAHGVIIQKRRSASMTAAAAKTASGAQEYIPIVKVNNLSNTIDELKKAGVFVVAADMDGISAHKCNLKGAMCFVIGSEGQGVSRLVKEKCDFIVKIDLFGNIDSLNASNAAAVLMYEKQRQEMKPNEKA
jgi:23S rRNA (guanosine2251-2'-O)-methyltransferase